VSPEQRGGASAGHVRRRVGVPGPTQRQLRLRRAALQRAAHLREASADLDLVREEALAWRSPRAAQLLGVVGELMQVVLEPAEPEAEAAVVAEGVTGRIMGVPDLEPYLAHELIKQRTGLTA